MATLQMCKIFIIIYNNAFCVSWKFSQIILLCFNSYQFRLNVPLVVRVLQFGNHRFRETLWSKAVNCSVGCFAVTAKLYAFLLLLVLLF